MVIVYELCQRIEPSRERVICPVESSWQSSSSGAGGAFTRGFEVLAMKKPSVGDRVSVQLEADDPELSPGVFLGMMWGDECDGMVAAVSMDAQPFFVMPIPLWQVFWSVDN